MNNKPKEETVRLIILGVPKSHVRMLKIKAATEGHHSLTGLMRKIIKEIHNEWVRKQKNNSKELS